jgi:surface antigen
MPHLGSGLAKGAGRISRRPWFGPNFVSVLPDCAAKGRFHAGEIMSSSIRSFGTLALLAVIATSCSTAEPVDSAMGAVSNPVAARRADQALVAEKVGEAGTGVTPLAWANPSTGSAGVIEQVATQTDGSDCRRFVTTQHAIDGSSERLAGLACPTGDAHWKMDAATN